MENSRAFFLKCASVWESSSATQCVSYVKKNCEEATRGCLGCVRHIPKIFENILMKSTLRLRPLSISRAGYQQLNLGDRWY